ncbi:MAG TPA: LptF/LptG family permease [Methylomirabilota bacterium]|nr:LptF/LptG family permease [Methylomirabilota bacterium]
MKTLYSYVTRQVLGTLFLAVAICTFVLLLGNALKDIVSLLLSGQASLLLVAKGFALLIPYVCVFALPVGLLAATLLTFGRLSADNELTAMRANGISLLSLALPLLVMSLGFAALCAWVNLDWAPRARVAYKTLLLQFGVKQTLAFLQEDRYITEIPGLVLHLRKRDGNTLHDVRLYQFQNNEMVLRAAAERGEILLDLTNKTLSLRLDQAIIEQKVRDTAGDPAARGIDWQPIKADFESPTYAFENLVGSVREPKLSEMSFSQLRRKIAELEQQGIPTMPARVQLHRQLSFSFASFAFTLVGIPLGIRAHRRETSIGIGIALLLLLTYYSFFILGEALQSKPELQPHLLLWLPNLLFQGLGGWLLWRANKGG